MDLLLLLCSRCVWLLLALVLLVHPSSSAGQGTTNSMSAPLLDDIIIPPMAPETTEAAAGTAMAAALPGMSAPADSIAGIESSVPITGLGAYIGCFNASSDWWSAGSENSTKVSPCRLRAELLHALHTSLAFAAAVH
jgi:hypothetical protein